MPKEVTLEVRKHLVVMSISAMESYFQGTAQLYIDNEWYKDSFLEVLRQEKITLAELIEINKEKMTIGEIITISRSFESLSEINIFFSKMFGINDFIVQISEFKMPTLEKNAFILKQRYPKYRTKIDDLISLRHKIIHHKYTKETISESKLMEMIEPLMFFVLCTDVYLMSNMKFGEL